MDIIEIAIWVGPIVGAMLGVLFSKTIRTFFAEVLGHPLRTSRIKRTGRGNVKVERSKRLVH